jgi:hypothetical protein
MKRTNMFGLASCEVRRKDGVTNPIIAAMFRGREGKRAVTVIGGEGFGALSAATMRSVARRFFGDDASSEVGDFILTSLLLGNREALKVLKDAFKHADRIFHRNHEEVLLKQAFVFMHEIGDRGENPERLKKAIEERFYNGEPLPQYRWRRLRKALGLPKQPTGAASSSYKRDGRSRRRKSKRDIPDQQCNAHSRVRGSWVRVYLDRHG